MQKNVQISVTGIQIENGLEAGCTQTLSFGFLEIHEEENIRILAFDETIEGVEGPVQNTMIIQPHEVALTKEGQLSSEMIFRAGNTTLSSFTTPYGNIAMEIVCTELQTWSTEKAFYTNISYQLQNNGQLISENQIKIKAKYIDK